MRAAALVMALLAACVDLDLDRGWTYDGPVNRCDGDGDCAAGTCRRDLGRCVVDPPAEGAVYWMRVTPGGGGNAPPQVFRATLGSGGEVPDPLAVHRPVVVQGATLAGDKALVASIVFIDQGNRLPGRAAPHTVYRSQQKVFDLELLPSTYDIVVLPEGLHASTYPPLYLDGVALDETGRLFPPGAQEPADLVLEEPLVTVSGRVTQGGQPVNGLAVRAVEEGGSGRAISTLGTTACAGDGTGCGVFSFGLARGVSAFSIRVWRPGEDHHPVAVAAGFEAPPEEEGAILDLGSDERLAFPALGIPLRYIARVERPVESSDGEAFVDPAPGCFVRFLGEDIGGGTVERWVTTNESGTIEESEGLLGVNLYPGDYSITVIPAEALGGALADYSPFLTASPVSIVGTGEIGVQVFPLAWRPLVKGTVVVDGDEVPQASLDAEPVPGTTAFPRSNSTSTGFDGLFSLWLDPAAYRVTVEAPLESGYAWAAEELQVDGNGETRFELPLPFALGAHLEPSAEQVDPIDVGGALVEVFVEIDGTAFPAGRATAGEDGDVAALLPPP